MKRRIIAINEEKCNGCGACAKACHEGAIGMVNGKAKLLRDDYCDGLGDCLPTCPTGAITFVEREATPYNEAAVKANMAAKTGCPGTACQTPKQPFLQNWPVQIKLAPIQAPYFKGADLLIAADCTAYAYPAFHRDFLAGRVVLIGCPKLDGVNYAEKLTQILSSNEITSVTLLRMEVPCCGGLEFALNTALAQCGKQLPVQVITVGIDGTLRD